MAARLWRSTASATAAASTLTVLRETVDKRLLAEVREQLLTPAALAELQAEVPERVEHLLEQASNTSGRRVAGAGFSASRRFLLA